jgi:hypothetical protein
MMYISLYKLNLNNNQNSLILILKIKDTPKKHTTTSINTFGRINFFLHNLFHCSK